MNFQHNMFRTIGTVFQDFEIFKFSRILIATSETKNCKRLSRYYFVRL